MWLKGGNDIYSIKMEKKLTTIICKIDLTTADLDFEKERKRLIFQQREEVTQHIANQYGVESIYELLSQKNQDEIIFPETDNEYYMNPKE